MTLATDLAPPATALTGRIPYPFTALVGQDEMRRALILTAIDPAIGSVLILGDRGTGKSTAVRGLAALLPPIEAVEGCPVNSARPEEIPDWADVRATGLVRRPTPVVDLPLGATEDRVTGALDVERAIARGEKAFQPGLLARANRGYLYIDEVNLLEDHLVDLLLDVAQSGENVVERDGLSIRHPARFVLIGSGNPEEGELTLLRAARALAALDGAAEVTRAHLRGVAAMALGHRLRRDPLDEAGSTARVTRALAEHLP